MPGQGACVRIVVGRHTLHHSPPIILVYSNRQGIIIEIKKLFLIFVLLNYHLVRMSKAVNLLVVNRYILSQGFRSDVKSYGFSNNAQESNHIYTPLR